MEENKINALMDMTVSKIRQLVDADTIIGKPISTPDGITVIPVSRMSFGIGTGGTCGLSRRAGILIHCFAEFQRRLHQAFALFLDD